MHSTVRRGSQKKHTFHHECRLRALSSCEHHIAHQRQRPTNLTCVCVCLCLCRFWWLLSANARTLALSSCRRYRETSSHSSVRAAQRRKHFAIATAIVVAEIQRIILCSLTLMMYRWNLVCVLLFGIEGKSDGRGQR